jgi:hypothetical protein
MPAMTFPSKYIKAQAILVLFTAMLLVVAGDSFSFFFHN